MPRIGGLSAILLAGLTASVAAGESVRSWRGERTFLWRDLTNETAAAVLVRPKGDGSLVKAGVALPVLGDGGLMHPDRVVWGGGRLVQPGESVRVVAELSVPRTGDVPARLSVGTELGNLEWGLEVASRQFPEGRARRTFLDLWQHPWAVARMHRVRPFSSEHYARMRPLWEQLADVGQKTITTTIMRRPWAHQCFDAYESMVRHVRRADGSWRFDYSVFDEYVAFAESCGLGPQIHCYTLCPFRLKRYYWEDEAGREQFGDFDVGSPAFADYWGAFLDDFARHLKEKGWFERTYIALDERSPAELKAVRDLLGAHGRFKVALAGNRSPGQFDGLEVDNFSIALDRVTDDFVAEARTRRKAGRTTSYYVCDGNPCLATAQAPIGCEWLGAYPGAVDLDGFLFWSCCSWPANPKSDTTYWPWFGRWAAGITFLLYPDGPSVRFLALRNGLNLAEKLRLLRDEGKIDAPLRKELEEFGRRKGTAYPPPAQVTELLERTKREVHRLSSGGVPPREGEIALDGAWTFCVESSEPVVRHGERKLRELLEGRFRVDCSGRDGTRRVVLAVAPERDALTSRLTVSENEVRVTGATPREVLQGCYRLEDELELRGRPCLAAGTRTYTRMFSPRMTHAGCEIEKFPDWHMDEIARAGMDAILVYVTEPPDVTRNGRVDMAAFVRRAAEHGLDVYAYLDRWNRPLEKHPLDPGAEPYYDREIGSIVRNAPGLKGLVCVGESCGFPHRGGKDPGFNSFAPVPDWAPWLELVAKVTRKWNPDFDVVFWTYNFRRCAEAGRLALLERIPTNVSVHVTFELGDAPRTMEGLEWTADDYTITRPGPGAMFTGEAAVVGRRGIRLTAMANTGGRTWDFGGAPYEPVPYCWLKRFRALRAAQRTYGLSGLMDSHHYGFTPNLCADIAKRAFTREVSDAELERCVEETVRRDFGEAAAPKVLAALRDWSAAMETHSAQVFDQWGVLRVGSTYPFVPLGAALPPAPPCLGGGAVTGWTYVRPEAGVAWKRRIEVEELPSRIALSARELELWRSGNDRLKNLTGEKVRRLQGVGKYCECAIRTQNNLQRYWKALADKKPESDVRKILDAEAENVRELIPYVSADPRLGWEPSMRAVTDPACLSWKLEQLKSAPGS